MSKGGRSASLYTDRLPPLEAAQPVVISEIISVSPAVARTLGCPRCLADPGEPCVSPSGLRLSTVHAERRRRMTSS